MPLLVFTDATVVDAQLNVLAPSLWAYQKSAPAMASRLSRVLLMNPANGCTMMINRALIDRARPIPREAVMHDAWLLLVAVAFGKADYVPRPTLRYRQHGRNEAGSRPWGPAYVVGQLRNLGAARAAIAPSAETTWGNRYPINRIAIALAPIRIRNGMAIPLRAQVIAARLRARAPVEPPAVPPVFPIAGVPRQREARIGAPCVHGTGFEDGDHRVQRGVPTVVLPRGPGAEQELFPLYAPSPDPI
jgi:hypothetical protein